MAMTPKTYAAAVTMALEDAEAHPESTARVPIPQFRGGDGKLFPVVRMRVENCLYNHRSGRIQAPLIDKGLLDKVNADPFSEASQEAIEHILRATPDYPNLLALLDKDGQEDPGIITRSGLLVNANTRLAILRELKREFISVLVLPPGVDNQSLLQIETALQVQRPTRQDYSLTNRLLHVKKWLDAEFDQEQIAEELKIKKAEVGQRLRMLEMVEEIRGPAFGDGRIPYSYFDEKTTDLEELDDRVQKAAQRDLAEADALKYIGYAGIMVGVPYRRQRPVSDVDVVADSLITYVEENDTAWGPQIAEMMRPSSVAHEDDDDLLGGDDVSEYPDLKPLVKTLASTFGRREVKLDKVTVQRTELVDKLKEAWVSVSEDQRQQDKQAQKATLPARRVQEAIVKISQADKSLADATREAEFDLGKLELQAKRLRQKATELEEKIAKLKGQTKSQP